MVEFPHPQTGELLETPADFQRAVGDLTEQLNPLYRARHAIENAWAERFPAPELPHPRARTPTQDKVARCPRCGGKLEKEEAP